MANEIEYMTAALQTMLRSGGINRPEGAKIVIVVPDARAAYDVTTAIKRQSADYGEQLSRHHDTLTVNGVTVMVRVPRQTVEV